MTRRGPRGPVPLYKKISGDLRESIEKGELKPGQALPKELEICEQYDASRLTVRNALKILREEGLIYTVAAVGSFVGPEDAPQIREPYPFESMAAKIRADIIGGKYRPDEPLPAESEMHDLFGVAKKTGRAAYSLLRNEGWAYTVPAMGTFVSQPDQWPTET
ncbi:GntR family transcriptional regulator [Planotetraspora phitsanulokensis]|nr:winged helix-turn-helix domain-containing protein [Planotetraspora phitsanulokensis]